MNVIEVSNVDKTIDNKKIINNLNLIIPEGNIFAMLGPNGAGKSTTIKLLNGILKPDNGIIKLFNSSDLQPQLRERIGILSDSALLYNNLSAEQNLMFFGELYGMDKKTTYDRMQKFLKLLKLDKVSNQKIQGYSTGMKKRIQLIKSVIHNPDLIFLDEPTSGLDPESTKEVNEFIYYLNKEENKTIFLCSHHLDEVEVLGHQFGFLSNGSLFSQGSLDTLKQNLVEKTIFSISDFQELPTFVKERCHIVSPNQITMVIENTTDYSKIIECLVNNKISIYNIESLKPTLKDVYFSLLEESKNELAKN